MTVGVGDDLLSIVDGETLIVEGDSGAVVIDPSPRQLLDAEKRSAPPPQGARGACRCSWAPGGYPRRPRRVAPLQRLDGGGGDRRPRRGCGGRGTPAHGAWLSLEADAWPTEDEHVSALSPPLAPLSGRVATVRTLDFGADKTTALFLAGIAQRGLTLMLAHPAELAKQLRAIVRAGESTQLRILLPPRRIRSAGARRSCPRREPRRSDRCDD